MGYPRLVRCARGGEIMAAFQAVVTSPKARIVVDSVTHLSQPENISRTNQHARIKGYRPRRFRPGGSALRAGITSCSRREPACG